MQRGVTKGLKVPCLFMITEVSIRCEKNPEVGIRRIPPPPIHHCLFLTTVTQLLLIAKHRVSVIVISHRPKYWQTAATHNKFLETSPNIKFPENLHPSHGSLPLPALSENKVRVTIFQTVATQSH